MGDEPEKEQELLYFDNDSHRNHSRDSQIEHNDSRDEDFNGIEMKDMATDAEVKDMPKNFENKDMPTNADNKENVEEVQQDKGKEGKPTNQGLEIIEINDAIDKKDSDWDNDEQ